MTTLTTVPQQKAFSSPVAQSLQEVLVGTYNLYLATHNYHWNVEGGRFFSLHTLFEGQYNELLRAIDGIGERIRSLNDYTIPFSSENVSRLAQLAFNPLNAETDSNLRSDMMLRDLISLHETVIENCRSSKEASQREGDDESESMMVDRIAAHQKAVWMLKSSLK